MAMPNIVDASNLFRKGNTAVASDAKKKWIKGAIGSPGALHRHLGIKPDEKIPEDRLREAANSKDPTIRKEASLAMTLKGFHHGKSDKKPARRPAKAVRHAMYGAKE